MPDWQSEDAGATLTGMSTKLIERGARIRRTKWVELSCLLCGEAAATLEGSTLRPRTPTSVRVNGARVVCGRCGGRLSAADQGERVPVVESSLHGGLAALVARAPPWRAVQLPHIRAAHVGQR